MIMQQYIYRSQQTAREQMLHIRNWKNWKRCQAENNRIDLHCHVIFMEIYNESYCIQVALVAPVTVAFGSVAVDVLSVPTAQRLVEFSWSRAPFEESARSLWAVGDTVPERHCLSRHL